MSSNTEEHKHQWTFDGDDPYVICECGARRDALTGKDIPVIQHATHYTKEERQLEGLAMNIVHQIGDVLYEALSKDVAHDHFVDARQATNDKLIDFVKGLILQHEATLKAAYEEKIREARLEELRLHPDYNGSDPDNYYMLRTAELNTPKKELEQDE